MVLENADVGLLANLAGQGGLHREAGRVGDVDHPARAVSALARQVVAVLVAGERNALVDQPVHRAPPVLDHEARRAAVIEVGAGGDRIADVCFDRVAVVQDGGDAALCPARGAVLEGPLADQGHPSCRREPQRRRLPGESTADYENIEAQHQEGSSPAKWAATIARDVAARDLGQSGGRPRVGARTAFRERADGPRTAGPLAPGAPCRQRRRRFSCPLGAAAREPYPASVCASFWRSFSQAENSRPSSGCVSPRTTLACISPSLLPQS